MGLEEYIRRAGGRVREHTPPRLRSAAGRIVGILTAAQTAEMLERTDGMCRLLEQQWHREHSLVRHRLDSLEQRRERQWSAQALLSPEELQEFQASAPLEWELASAGLDAALAARAAILCLGAHLELVRSLVESRPGRRLVTAEPETDRAASLRGPPLPLLEVPFREALDSFARQPRRGADALGGLPGRAGPIAPPAAGLRAGVVPSGTGLAEPRWSRPRSP